MRLVGELTRCSCGAWRWGPFCWQYVTFQRLSAGKVSLPEGDVNGALLTVAEADAMLPPFHGGDEEATCRELLGGRCRFLPPTPRFDEDLLTLFATDEPLHCFSDQAHNEVAILKAFENVQWRGFVSYPLGQPSGSERSRKHYGDQLKMAVLRLNQCQKKPQRVLFHSHPSSGIVTWQWVCAEAQPSSNQTVTAKRLQIISKCA